MIFIFRFVARIYVYHIWFYLSSTNFNFHFGIVNINSDFRISFSSCIYNLTNQFSFCGSCIYRYLYTYTHTITIIIIIHISIYTYIYIFICRYIYNIMHINDADSNTHDIDRQTYLSTMCSFMFMNRSITFRHISRFILASKSTSITFFHINVRSLITFFKGDLRTFAHFSAIK